MNNLDNKGFYEIEKSLGYIFVDKELLKRALTHLSYYEGVTEKIDNSGERLEYLGDAVLGLLVKEFLFLSFKDRDEGGLTLISSYLLSDKNLAKWCKDISLDRFILLGKGEEMQHGREKVSILAHTFEALIGAMYLDGGLYITKRFIVSRFLERENLSDFIA